MDIVAPGCIGRNGPVHVLFAFLLVVTGDVDRSRRTTPDTGSAASIMKMKTVSIKGSVSFHFGAMSLEKSPMNCR